jgi:hypothetical protein
VQHGDGRIAVQDAFVLGVAQFIDAGLLLGQQRRARIAGVVAAMPPSNGLSRRRWAIWAARIMILDGTQPTLTQVPPMVPRSISVTRAPCSTAFSAAAIAAPPLPMTAP